MANTAIHMPRTIPFSLSQLAGYDCVIDVRSPAEYAADHVPGALNFPVLDDAQRIEVGTLHKQSSAFEAKKRGAALVARNIAAHLQTPFFTQQDKKWKPLVYCWRGGKRSGSMTHVLQEIGWPAAQLEGGYKSFRNTVIAELASLPARFTYRVVCGETGSGKSRLLQALKSAGAQVLDLENIAHHRGSVLGNFPHEPQPTQKAFDTALWHALAGFDPMQPIFVEAESKKIGNLRVPDALVHAMWQSPCVRLVLPFAQRVALLQEEYGHFFTDPGDLCVKLDGLVSLHGKAVVENWKALAHAKQWAELTSALLTMHYDPAYRRSTGRNYPQLAAAAMAHCDDPGPGGMQRTASQLLKSLAAAEIPA
jgi:tRNA 2-selenouridine synthase